MKPKNSSQKRKNNPNPIQEAIIAVAIIGLSLTAILVILSLTLDNTENKEPEELTTLAEEFCQEKNYSLDRLWYNEDDRWQRDDGLYYQIDCRVDGYETKVYWAKINIKIIKEFKETWN